MSRHAPTSSLTSLELQTVSLEAYFCLVEPPNKLLMKIIPEKLNMESDYTQRILSQNLVSFNHKDGRFYVFMPPGYPITDDITKHVSKFVTIRASLRHYSFKSKGGQAKYGKNLILDSIEERE